MMLLQQIFITKGFLSTIQHVFIISVKGQNNCNSVLLIIIKRIRILFQFKALKKIPMRVFMALNKKYFWLFLFLVNWTFKGTLFTHKKKHKLANPRLVINSHLSCIILVISNIFNELHLPLLYPYRVYCRADITFLK